MDQQNPNQNNANQPIAGVITEDQKKALFAKLGLSNASPERQQALMDQMVDTLITRIFARVSGALSEDDLEQLEQLSKQPDGEQAVNQMLVAKVPNFDAIANEEMESFGKEMQEAVGLIKASLPQ